MVGSVTSQLLASRGVAAPARFSISPHSNEWRRGSYVVTYRSPVRARSPRLRRGRRCISYHGRVRCASVGGGGYRHLDARRDEPGSARLCRTRYWHDGRPTRASPVRVLPIQLLLQLLSVQL